MYNLNFYHTHDQQVTTIESGFATLIDAQGCLYLYATRDDVYFERDCDSNVVGFAYYSNVGQWGYRYYIEACNDEMPTAPAQATFDQVPYDPTFDYPIAESKPVSIAALLAKPTLTNQPRQPLIVPDYYRLVVDDGLGNPTICDYCDLVADWFADYFGFFSHPVIVATLYFSVLGLVLTHLTNR